jgi:hypothetical protein
VMAAPLLLLQPLPLHQQHSELSQRAAGQMRVWVGAMSAPAWLDGRTDGIRCQMG